MFKQFADTEGRQFFRPLPTMKACLEHDGIAFCAGCTQFHEGVDAKAVEVLCADCGQHLVFGHLQLSQI